MEEIELIDKVKAGDMQAFEQLFELYKRKAIQTVYLITGDQVVSEDIVQEAFVACYISIKSLRSPEYFKTWFFKLLTRTAWRYMKKEKSLMPVEDIVERVERESSSYYIDEFEQRESARALYVEILKLEPKLQTTLILYYYNEFSIKEIAKIMGCLEGTVKSRLHTGRKKLKLHLTAEQNVVTLREDLSYENK